MTSLGVPLKTVVFLDRATLVAQLRPLDFHHRWVEYPDTAAAEVVSRLQDANVAVTNKVPLPRAALEKLPRLEMVALAATGADRIDLDYCRGRGIAVANVRDYACHAVPEHVFLLMLALRRNLLSYHADVRAGRWQQASQFCLFGSPIHDLAGTTLGVVGYGTLGQAVARLAAAFGMRVLVAERKGAGTVRDGRVEFTEVLARSDVLSLHSPLTADTRGMIGARELALMKPSALLINTARGPLVDEAALVAALRGGRLGGAGLDVLVEEPPSPDNPLLAADVLNLVVTPHVAWASVEAMQGLANQLLNNIDAWAHGTPMNRLV